MKRIRYYVIHCTQQERENDKEHYEEFETEEQALKRAEKISNDEFIAVEKHNEVYERWDWLPDWNMGENWCERII